MLGGLQSGHRGKYFVCANPHSLEVARKDRLFDEAIRNADLILPDGVGIVMASKILGGNIRDRVTGSDVFWGLNRVLDKEGGYSCFFLGSTEENLRDIRTKMEREFPGIRVAGVYAPPYKAEFDEKDSRLMVEAVNNAQPDVLWVGMTAPKQEKWIHQNRERLHAKCIGPVGAVFDFYTGRVKRSHPLFQKIGLEWLPRLLRQPGRLWRRNFVSNPSFLYRVIMSRFLFSK
jgi:N-acetylglucosaminyldiphosphoundecaprenol N-acetyl-beta-D-mannosaminyltransferase